MARRLAGRRLLFVGRPAANTELAVGDVITSIYGVDAGVLASETVCALFEPPPGTVLQLAVARGATVTVVAAPR